MAPAAVPIAAALAPEVLGVGAAALAPEMIGLGAGGLAGMALPAETAALMGAGGMAAIPGMSSMALPAEILAQIGAGGLTPEMAGMALQPGSMSPAGLEAIKPFDYKNIIKNLSNASKLTPKEQQPQGQGQAQMRSQGQFHAQPKAPYKQNPYMEYMLKQRLASLLKGR